MRITTQHFGEATGLKNILNSYYETKIAEFECAEDRAKIRNTVKNHPTPWFIFEQLQKLKCPLSPQQRKEYRLPQ